MEREKNKQTKTEKLAVLLDKLATMCRSGFCADLDDEIVDAATDSLKSFLNVRIKYKKACEQSGMKYGAMCTAANRDGVKVDKDATLPYNWVETQTEKKKKKKVH